MRVASRPDRDGILQNDPRGISEVNSKSWLRLLPICSATPASATESRLRVRPRRSHFAQTKEAANPGVQIVLRSDGTQVSWRGHRGDYWAERLRKIEHRGRDFMGAWGAIGEVVARFANGGCHLLGHSRPQSYGNGRSVADVNRSGDLRRAG